MNAIFIHSIIGVFLVLTFDNVLGCPNVFRFCARSYENCIFRFNVCTRRKGFVRVEEFEDEDVKTEEARVKELSKHDLPVRVANFSKIYTQGFSRTLAVRNASFGLDFGECFALLGVNGAGKTTTFRSLTNET